MKYFVLVLLVLTGFSTALHAGDEANSSYTSSYRTLVDGDGNIAIPDDFQRKWVFLGSWSVAEKDVQQSGEASGHRAASLHNVYTQPDVVEYYHKHQTFPDGAIFIKELLEGVTAPMTTGTVSRAGETEGWFVMVKDTQQRFADKAHWGDGWGWALIKVNSGKKSVTKNYKSECMGCHIPAKSTDWIYIDGYPLLRANSHKP